MLTNPPFFTTLTLIVHPALYNTERPIGSSFLSSGVISTKALSLTDLTKNFMFLSWQGVDVLVVVSVTAVGEVVSSVAAFVEVPEEVTVSEVKSPVTNIMTTFHLSFSQAHSTFLLVHFAA